MTTFESVEALWESQYKVWKPTQSDQGAPSPSLAEETPEENPFEAVTSDGLASQMQEASTALADAEVDVDEALLSSQEISRIVEQEELEWETQEGEQQDTEFNEESLEEAALPDPFEEDESTPHASPLR